MSYYQILKKERFLTSVALFIFCWQWGSRLVFAGCLLKFHVHRAQIQNRRDTLSALCLASSDCVSCSHAQKHNAYCTQAKVCDPTCHCATALNLPTPKPRRCTALNRQWLIYGMIVYFALLSVMDEDLQAFEKSVWNMEESGGRGGVLKINFPKEKCQRAYGATCHHINTSS